MLAQVGQLELHELRGRFRKHDLSAVTRRGDSCTEVNVVADVALLADVRRAGVQTHTHGDRSRGERLGDVPTCSLQRAGRGGERVEEGVALSVQLDAAVSAAPFPQHAPVVDQGLVVRLGPELVQQLRRALDVREEAVTVPEGRSPRTGVMMRQSEDDVTILTVGLGRDRIVIAMLVIPPIAFGGKRQLGHTRGPRGWADVQGLSTASPVRSSLVGAWRAS